MSWTTHHVPLSRSFVQKSPNTCNTTTTKENSGPGTRCPRLSTGAIFSQSRAWEWVSKVSTKWGTHQARKVCFYLIFVAIFDNLLKVASGNLTKRGEGLWISKRSRSRSVTLGCWYQPPLDSGGQTTGYTTRKELRVTGCTLLSFSSRWSSWHSCSGKHTHEALSSPPRYCHYWGVLSERCSARCSVSFSNIPSRRTKQANCSQVLKNVGKKSQPIGWSRRLLAGFPFCTKRESLLRKPMTHPVE